jgi:hypothetical protein
MKTCKLIILDQVNIKFEGLDPTTRRHLVDKMKIMVPYARHTPQFKMGRWDGKVPFATVGGGSYLNLLDEILPVLVANDYDIGSMEIEDRRIQPSFNFTEITDEFFADTLWPKGHPNEDEPIMMRDHQVNAVNRFINNLQSMQEIATGAGKAQPLDALVKTPNGWTKMGDLKLGDIVIAHDGSKTKILGIYPQGLKQTYKITFSDGRSTRACPDHLWKVHCASWGRAKKHNHSSWKIIDTRTIAKMLDMKSHKNRLSIPLFTPDLTSDDISLPIHPYLMGALLGDGSFRHNRIVFSTADSEIIESLNNIVGPDYLFSYIGQYDYILKKAPLNNTKYNIYVKLLKELQLMENYSYEKHIPDIYFNASLAQKLDIIRGLMDTDGTVGRNGEVYFSSSSLLLAKGVQTLIRSLGGKATIKSKTPKYTYNGKKMSGRIAYSVNIIYSYPSSLFSLQRKKEKASVKHQFDLRLRISKIEEMGIEPAQCIMIDHPSHLYVTDDYIVTHNTIITAALSTIVEPYGRSLVIVPGKDLVRQTWKDYANIGIDVGRYYGDFKEPDNTHTIATWQSISAATKNNPEVVDRMLDNCQAVIVDEAHTIRGAELQKFLNGKGANVPIRWALSGTIPDEKTAKHEYWCLLSSVGPVVGEVKPEELQEKGILAKCHIHIKQTVDDVTYPDFPAEREFLAKDKTRVNWLAAFCSELADKGNTLVLVNSVDLGKSLSQILNVPFIFGEVKSSTRGEEYDSINDTDNKLLIASFGVASTGISINRIFNLVLVESGVSPTRVIQSAGRGLRVAADKDHVDIYDICSTAKFSKRHLAKRKIMYGDKNYPYDVEKIDYR